MRFIPARKISENKSLVTTKQKNVANYEQKAVETSIENSGEYIKGLIKGTNPIVKRYSDTISISFERSSIPSSVMNVRGRNAKRINLKSDYDLSYAERLYEKEGIIRKYVTTATAKVLRADFLLVENPSFIGTKAARRKGHAIINQKLHDILRASNFTWYELLQTTIKEVLGYGNTFIYKILNKGKINKILSDDPLFYEVTVNPKTMEHEGFIRQPFLRPKPHSEDTYNNYGGILQLYPSLTANDSIRRDAMAYIGYGVNEGGGTITGKEQRLSNEQIIHIRYMIEKNAPMALPPALASAVDIEDMRTLEENLILLGWQYGHPILHITVNAEGLTQDQADIEIERTIQAIERMDATGFLATTDRAKVQLHYPNGSVVPIDKFVSYLQSRVKGNLDTAALLLGDGADAGRQAGETIEAASNDINQMIANIIAGRLQMHLIEHIYKEEFPSSIGPAATTIKLNEIDRNRRAAKTNQLINLMNGSAMGPDKVREDMGMGPITEDEWSQIERLATLRKGKNTTVNPQNQYGEQTPGTTKD